MSNRAINAVLDFSHTKGDDRVLMFVIADGISKDSGAYPAKVSTLIRQCNRSESAIHRHVNRCIRLGELVVLDGIRSPNTFYIPILQGEAGYAPEACESDEHSCNGYHTPLSVNREDIAASAIKAARQQRRSQRKSQRRGASIDTPNENATGVSGMTPGGASIDTPGCQEWHPRVSDVAPNTNIDSPFITPDIYLGAPTPTEKSSTDEMSAAARTPTPPMPPAPPLPAEQRELWATVRRDLARHMTGARLRHFDGAHLYALDPASAAYALYVPSHAAAQQAALYEQDMARAIRISTGHPDVSITVLTGQYREAAHA